MQGDRVGAHIRIGRRGEVAGSPGLELSARGGHAADPDLVYAWVLSSRVVSKNFVAGNQHIGMGTLLKLNVAVCNKRAGTAEDIVRLSHSPKSINDKFLILVKRARPSHSGSMASHEPRHGTEPAMRRAGCKT